MNASLRCIIFLLLLVLIVTGCAQVPKEAGFNDVDNLVGDRVNYRLSWNQGTETDREVEKAIQDLLKAKLTPDTAVQIALLNNPDLQAVYEELGITQADVVEAGLLENPVLFGQARWSSESGAATNYEFDITQNFLNILMLPARKKLSAIRFEQVKLHVADEVVRLAAEVKNSFFTVLVAQQIMDMRSEIAFAAQSSFELAQRLYTAGNIADLSLAKENAFYEQTRLELSLIHISEPTRLKTRSRMPSSA